MTRPVLLYATSKSGSSMTTRIFHEHGLWVGRWVEKNGYPCYENEDLKDRLRGLVTPPRFNGFRRLRAGVDRAEFRAVVDELMPADGWVVKTGIDWWYLWRDARPAASAVIIHRPPEQVARSMHDGSSYDSSIRVVLGRYERMDEIRRQHGLPVIKTHRVVAGDYSSLEAAFEHCGMRFDPAIADRCIRREMWHHFESSA